MTAPGAQTNAHLGSTPNGLVLDVDEPAALLRVGESALPGYRGAARSGGWRRIPGVVRLSPQVRQVVDVEVRSRGRHLGQLHMTPRGGWRFRPTVAGIRVLLAPLLRAWVARQWISRGRTRA